MQQAIDAIEESPLAPAPQAMSVWDTLAAISLAAGLVASVAYPVVPPSVRFVLAVLAIVVAPGYLITELTFPRHDQLSPAERLGLTLLTSVLWAIAWVTFLGVVHLRLDAINGALGTSGVLVAGALGLTIRRRSVPSDDLHRLSRPAGVVAGVLAGILLIGGLTAMVAAQDFSRTHVALYLTGAGGQLMNYPSPLTVGPAGPLTIHAVDLHSGTSYRVVLNVPGMAQRQWKIGLQHGASWDTSLTLPLPKQGSYKARATIELYYGTSTAAFRTVWLWYK